MFTGIWRGRRQFFRARTPAVMNFGMRCGNRLKIDG